MIKQRRMFFTLMLAVSISIAQEPMGKTPTDSSEPVIKPPLERRNIVLPRIDTEDFELGGYFGIYSTQDFGAEALWGMQFDYHITEDFFLDLVWGLSQVDDSVLRNNGITLFTDPTLVYYSLGLGINIFPGEIFIGRRFAKASAFYLLGSVGSTKFRDEDRFTTSFGFGMRVLMTDWFSTHIDVRDHMFENDLTGEKKLTHNIAIHMGVSLFF